MRMSKNGSDFYEVADEGDEVEQAKAKGYRSYTQMTKNGTDIYDIEMNEDEYKTALAKGYQDVKMHAFTKGARERSKPGKIEANFRGAIGGLTQEYGDELGGFLEKAGSKIGLRGVGSPNLMDIRFETDAEDKEDPDTIQRNARDARRSLNKAAEEAHPGIYNASNIAGSLVTGLVVPGSKAVSSLKAGVGIGAAQGLGRSEADLVGPNLDDVAQAGIDTASGALMGAAGHGAGKVLEKAAKAPAALAKGTDYLRGLGRGSLRGAKEVGKDLPLVVQPFAEAYGALKGALSEVKELNSTAKEISGIAKEARDLLAGPAKTGGVKLRPLQELTAIGNGKTLQDFSDDEAILAAMMSDGDNAVKKWFAGKAGTLQPGQIDSDDYNKVLGLGSQARTTAREFNPKEAAKALKPTVEGVQNLFKGARSARFGELQEAAKGTFDDAGSASVLQDVKEALIDADKLKSIPGSVRNAIGAVDDMLSVGLGAKPQKLTPGAWSEVSRGERFHRLQQSREYIDQQLNWSKREGHGQAESMLRGLRSNIDDALKTSPEKVEADELYKASKDVEGKFFGSTEFRNATGGVEIDEGKLARLLGNTDQAARFKASMEDLKKFADRPELGEAFKGQAKKLIEDLEGNIGIADTKRLLGEFRFKQGPSSPAVERMGSVARGNTLLQDAVQSPAGFVGSVDQFDKMLKDKLGKGFNELNATEKTSAARYWTWAKKNQDAGMEKSEKMWSMIFKK